MEYKKQDEFQQEQTWNERKEKEAIRAPIRIELKPVLDELRKASKQSAQELLNLIYAKHPPKRGTKSTDPSIRARYKMALLHYHPDKQDPEEHGLKWIVLSEEITVLLTYHFERMKSDPELENTSEQEDSCSESDDSSQCKAEDVDRETNSKQNWHSWTDGESSATEDSFDYHEYRREFQLYFPTSDFEDSSDGDGAIFYDYPVSKKPFERFFYPPNYGYTQYPPEQMDASVNASKDDSSTDMQHWKEIGFSGAFFSINCQSLRIGSYRFTCVESVLFSPEGFMVRAPILNPRKTCDIEWISLSLPMSQLLKVEANFDQDLLVIFLHCTPSLCRKVSAKLHLRENGKLWNPDSLDESQRLLTMFPSCLDDSLKEAIKETFTCKGVFREITTSEARKALLISSPSQD